MIRSLPGRVLRPALRAFLRLLGPRARRILREEILALRGCELATELSLDGVVVAGPFAGLRLPSRRSWPSAGDVPLPLVLGTYERELHGPIERAVARGYDTVINVGCAEGYYAVGLARRLPTARVLAFDIDAMAQLTCRETARMNGMAERVQVAGAIEPDDLGRLLERSGRTLVLLDCEGYEDDLLEPTRAPGLAHADLIVEFHDFAFPGITDRVLRRFEGTHHVERLAEGDCDPRWPPILHDLNGFDRLLCVCEYRPQVMTYAVLTAGGPCASAC